MEHGRSGAGGRVVIAHELGAGWWHAVLAGALGRALGERGVAVVLATPDPVSQRPLLGPGIAVVPAPRGRDPRLPERFAARSYADILGAAGWADAPTREALVATWRDLFALAAPDVVVVDHAPTARLAAERMGLPTVAIGLGFGEPPPEAIGTVLQAVPATYDPLALAALRPVAPARSAVLVTTFTELDPWASRRAAPTVGPIEPLPAPSPSPARGVFAYLAGDDARTPAVLAALAAAGPVEAVVRGPAFDAAAEVPRGVVLHRGPIDVAPALARAAAVVHHGGAGLVHQAAAAGRPQLVLPSHLEQGLNAAALARLGVGVACPDAAAITAALPAALGPAMRERAARWAALVAATYDPSAACAQVVAAVVAVIAAAARGPLTR